MDEINKTAETSLITLTEVSEPGQEKKGTDSDHNFLLPGLRLCWPSIQRSMRITPFVFTKKHLESNLLLSTILNELEKPCGF